MNEPYLQPCLMCGSPARVNATGTAECHGWAWQTCYVECTDISGSHCDMEVSIYCDNSSVSNAWETVIEMWNKLKK